MTRAEALEALGSPDLHLRLRAARMLAQSAQPGDSVRLQEALTVEKVMWVRTALRQAIARTASDKDEAERTDEDMGDIVSPEVLDQIRTISVNETTKRVVHEIAPILGVLRMYAKEEVRGFDTSKTREQIERLQELLRALDRLSQAAVAPSLSEFDLSALIRGVVESEAPTRKVKVDLAGPTPLVVVGDPGLVDLALGNGVRNAIEAVEGLYAGKDDPPSVVINWGETDRDVWIAVLDRGPGPPVAVDRAFEIGSTTKENHLGMGLATARQAVISMSGTVFLRLRTETGGAQFEFRWPKTAVPEE
jgi:signal transduction histidine kinase